jgi:hypothetical protein
MHSNRNSLVKETRTHVFIGALCLPGRKDHPRYVFVSKHKSASEQLRVIRCNKGKSAPVQVWLEKLNAMGFAPEVITLARVPVGQAAARKTIWIRLLIENEFPIYNSGSEGGRRRRPTLYVQRLQERIIKEHRPVKRWQRTLSTLKQNYQIEIGQRKRRIGPSDVSL